LGFRKKFGRPGGRGGPFRQQRHIAGCKPVYCGSLGAIESALLNRTIPKYWSKRGGFDSTNKMINLLLGSLMKKLTKK
jgi:hypothetical protein